jgi:hypothetical protein
MRARLYNYLIALVLLTAFAFAILSSGPVISARRAVIPSSQHEHIARHGVFIVCQSGHACGG